MIKEEARKGKEIGAAGGRNRETTFVQTYIRSNLLQITCLNVLAAWCVQSINQSINQYTLFIPEGKLFLQQQAAA